MRQLSIEEQAEVKALKWSQNFQIGLDEHGQGVYTHGDIVHGDPDKQAEWVSSRFGLEADMSGLSVLDVGANGGLFTFEAERRGAKVTALDVEHADEFALAAKLLDSKAEHYKGDITAKVPKKRDVVLCFGVLYHLKNPQTALFNLYKATKQYALIETALIPSNMSPPFPCWMLTPDSFDGDPTNWSYPNLQGLIESCKYAGFADVEVLWREPGDVRATVKAKV